MSVPAAPDTAAAHFAARERLAVAALVVLAALAFVAIRGPYLSIPLERDEGEYAYIAQRMLAGDVPYRDAFDQKPPAAFAAYLLAFATTGRSVEGIHAFAGIWTAATALLLFLWTRALAGGLAAGFAVLAFAVVSTDPSLFATAANTELFMLLPLTGAALCLWRGIERDGLGAWLAAGALLAAACWFKPVAVWNALFALALAVGEALGRRPRAPASLPLRRVAALALGALACSAPVVLALVASGAWSAFLDAVVFHNLAYSQRMGPGDGLALFLRAVDAQAPSFALLWAAAIVALGAPKLHGWRVWGFLAGWWLASGLGVATGFYFRPHYFVQALPALAALAGVGFAALARRALEARAAALAALALAALAAAAVLPPAIAHRDALRAASPAELSWRLYGYNPFAEAASIARHIRANSAPEDTVFVLGSEPEILFHAERRSATRHIFVYPLTGPYPGVRELQEQTLAEVRAARPRYIVWVNIQASLLSTDETERLLFQETAKLVREAYRLEFLARPIEGQPEFATVHGPDAAQLMRQLLDDPESPAWVAVYRRAS